MSLKSKRRKAVFTAIATVLIISFLFSLRSGSYETQSILDAIRQVESSGNDNCPDGDGGKAIGPFQIHAVYWQDAVEAEPSLKAGHDYQDCRKRDYAEQIVRSYLKRWAPDAWDNGDAETLARIHNGGPRGYEKTSTEKYWAKVQLQLEE